MATAVLTSVSGSPGTTTLSLALCIAWEPSRPIMMIEADPRGGVCAVRFGMAPEHSVPTLLPAARRALTLETLQAHLGVLPQDLMGRVVRVLLGGRPYEGGPELTRLWQRLGEQLTKWGLDAVIDIGRFTPANPARPLLDTASAILVVTKPDLESIASVRDVLPLFRPPSGLVDDALDKRIRVVASGAGAYTSVDIEDALGCPTAEVHDDPYAAAVLSGDRRYRVDVPRSRLVHSARSLINRKWFEPMAKAESRGGNDGG